MQLILIETFWDLHKFKLKERYYIDDKGLKQGNYELYHMNGIINEINIYKDNNKQSSNRLLFENGQEYLGDEESFHNNFYSSGNSKH